METALLIFAALLAVTGLIGSILPVLPGTPLNLMAILILHFTRGGQVFETATLVVLGVLTALALILDYALPMAGARLYGASKYGMWGTVIGMIIGMIFFNVIGLIVGMILGAVVGELIAGKELKEAFKSGGASLAGSVAAFVLKFGLSVAMTVLFFWKLVVY